MGSGTRRGGGGGGSRYRQAFAGRGGRGGGGGGGGRGGKYGGGKQGNVGRGGNGGVGTATAGDVRRTGWSRTAQIEGDEQEARMGYEIFTDGERLGWLVNMRTASIEDEDLQQGVWLAYPAGVLNAITHSLCLHIKQDGSTFKAHMKFAPYFYVGTTPGKELEVESYLRRRYETRILDVEIVQKEDLDLKNHLSGLRRAFLKVSFINVQLLMDVKRDLVPLAHRNAIKTAQAATNEQTLLNPSRGETLHGTARVEDYAEHILELREYDVPYHMRFAIDNDVRCGHWYTVSAAEGTVTMEHQHDMLQRAEPRICAFDIETTKLPLKFPDASYDSIMMISYMIDKQGYLIVNREVVGGDIEDLEYTPKPEFEGPFKVTNVPNEQALIRQWFEHMKTVKPNIYVTYNGDYFDWPFIEKRAAEYGLSMLKEIGFQCDGKTGECRSKFASHMDCLAWVQRDSYLPQGSQGLKAVTKAKLGYDPMEVHPENMMQYAKEKPQIMSSYSVSDAVATFHLYTTYVHPFIFSLSTIIPMPPDEVLRKGSGTLCEALLMVEAFKGNIICPNKNVQEPERWYKGHLLESETYIGGHVECLESGVFRSDLPTRFRLVPEAYQQLIDNLDRDLKYAIEVEEKVPLDSVTNYDEVRDEILGQLVSLRDTPNREERPVIYHLDVAAMYPNIILTNRLQPPAIVTDETCASCDFNRPGKTCLRKMDWVWRGDYYTANRNEYNSLKNQLQSESLPPAVPGGPPQLYHELPEEQQGVKLKERLKKYCQKVYKRVLDKPTSEHRTANICMRENPFYVDTVRSFRDRRYDYKGFLKTWKGKLHDARKAGAVLKIQEAQDMIVVYDSLQLAHKCILNSFYGYVMRRGARWYSMEMAGVVTYTGAKIIQSAHRLVEQIGKPLELDTDGIWCALPASFPENYEFRSSDSKKTKFVVSYPCVMLNVDVALNNTNDQYQAMILPASKEEGKLIKKRYAVFNDDGSLAELKGFEIKRRGELKLIKVFQSEVFENFLQGETLEECYEAVGAVANRWLDMIENRGTDLADSELLELISESSTMSKSLEDYGEQKSCPITTAKRLADFLGDEMVRDKGLNCQYIVANKPEASSVCVEWNVREMYSARTQLAACNAGKEYACNNYAVLHIPSGLLHNSSRLAVLTAPCIDLHLPACMCMGLEIITLTGVLRSFLRRWCKESLDGDQLDVRNILDWEYYRTRLGSAIQKIITIPAAMQKVANPVPRVQHPDWLGKRVREKEDLHRQRTLTDMFSRKRQHTEAGPVDMDMDMEDFGVNATSASFLRTSVAATHANTQQQQRHAEAPSQDVDDDRAERQEDRPAGAPTDEEAECPTREDDYVGWLKHSKRRWRRARLERKKLRLAEAREAERAMRQARAQGLSQPYTPPIRGPSSRADVGSYFRQREALLLSTPWQIVQISPADTPGSFRAWVIVEGAMFSVPLHVSREFYINTRTTPDSDSYSALGSKCTRLLPHSRPCLNLQNVRRRVCGMLGGLGLSRPCTELTHCARVQIVVSEDNYQDNAKELAANLVDPDVEVSICMNAATTFDAGTCEPLYLCMSLVYVQGIYETQVPLYFHAVLELGCSASVKPRVRRENRSLEQGFALQDLEMKMSAECDYLPDRDASSSLRSIHVYHSCSETRGVYMLVTPATAKALLVVVSHVSNKEVTPGMMERALKDSIAASPMAQHAQQSELYASIKFEVEYERSHEAACKLIQRAIGNYRSSQGGPTAAVVEVCEGMTDFCKKVPALQEFPCLAVPFNQRDNQYQALGWQPVVSRLAAQRGIASVGWLLERRALARYAHVCSNILLESQALKSVVPGMFLRLRLRVPLGNFDADWMLYVADVFFSRALRDHNHVLWMSNTGMPDLGGVAMQDELSFTDEVQRPELCYPGAYGQLTVELKIQHLAVNALLKSALLDELEGNTALGMKGSGPTISSGFQADDSVSCAASFKILRQMVQNWVTDAVNTRNVIADALLQQIPISKLHDPALHRLLNKAMQKMFAHLLAELRKLGAGIVFADFTRIIITTGKRTRAAAVEYVKSVQQALQSRELFEYIHLREERFWYSLLFMDQDRFVVIVSEYIYNPWKHTRTKLQADTHAEDDGCTPSVTRAVADEADEEEAEFLRGQVAGYFTFKLLKWMREIHLYAGSTRAQAAGFDFPQLAGSHRAHTTPALEFAKSVSAVLALDKRAEHEVAVLRRNLLASIQVGEYAEEAQFVDPCLSFSLPNVLNREESSSRLTPVIATTAGNWTSAVTLPSWRATGAALFLHAGSLTTSIGWKIPCCTSPGSAYACTKCRICGAANASRQVKREHFSDYCRCAGRYVCTQPREEFLRSLRVFLNIAKYHRFELLQECVQWALQPGPL
eukprot:jgi/Chlat1/1391/Chrsp12S02054